MYVPDHFSETRLEQLHRLIVEHPFGMLVTTGQGGLDANHLPFHLDPAAGPYGTLHAHVARANSVWKDMRAGCDVLVVFRAEHAYISPTWYPSKHELHEQVPTWNYKVVHAHGQAMVMDDDKFVRGVIARLTRTHEAPQPAPWKMGDAPKDYLDRMVRGIVGIRIEVTSLVGKFKLSQNRELRDRQGAGEALKRQGDTALGQAMLDTPPISSVRDP